MPLRGELPSHTPITLINRLRGAADGEWRTFHGIYAPVVYRLCLRARLGAHDADDVTSRVMTALHRNIEKGYTVDHDIGRFRDYLATLTQRTIATHYREDGRRKRRRGEAREAQARREPRPAPPEELLRMERQERIRTCLDELRTGGGVRPRDWEAFEAYALREEPAKAVAERYGMTLGRLYQLKTRMLRRIGEALVAQGVE